jgi:hypothetical protein
MYKMKIIVPIMLIMMLLLSGCGKAETTIPDGSTTKVSQCDAVRIARTAVPKRIADLTPTNAGFRADLGKNGTWFVNYANVNIVFSELGWHGKAEDYFKRYDLEQHEPNGVYANITIYVDAGTGEVTNREIHNAYILGPIQNLSCE